MSEIRCQRSDSREGGASLWSLRTSLAETFGVGIFLVLGAWNLVLLPCASAQGSLTPPGAPAATMKSLDQIASTGIAINTTNTPGDSSYEFVISQAGSYFLTGNLGVTKTNGIHVTVEGVSIDLNAFQISRSSGSGGDGIHTDPSGHRCVIKNGTIKGFANGILCSNSGTTPAPHGGSLSNLIVSSCTSFAIFTGKGWRMENCQASDNTGDTAIFVDGGSSLSNCVAFNNQASGTSTVGAAAIFAGSGSTLLNCSSMSNTSENAILVGDDCVLLNCTAYNNTVARAIQLSKSCTANNCAANLNTCGIAFASDNGSSFSNCSASFNIGPAGTACYGFATGACTLTGCSSVNNFGGSGSGNTGTGIAAGPGTSLIGCTSQGNHGPGIVALANGPDLADGVSVLHCTVTGNYTRGIYGHDGWMIRDSNVSGNCVVSDPNSNAGIIINNRSMVVGCTVTDNANSANGIRCATGNTVANNVVMASSSTPSAIGIDVTGFGNRIEANEIRDYNGAFGRGIRVETTDGHNVIIRNTAGNNTLNYDIPSGNGNTPTITDLSSSAASNPWANIQN